MPIYEYVCSSCGKVNDVLQKVDDPAPEACEACHQKGTLSKVVSRTSFVLKGGGWYSDLYGSPKKGEGNGGKASSGASGDAGETKGTPSSSSSSTPTTGGSGSSTTNPSGPAAAAAASAVK